MAATEIFQTIAKIWLAFVGFICSLFSKSSKHEDDAKPPILPLTANKPVANHGAPELVRTHMYIEDAASPRNFVAAGMMPYYEDDTERFIRDIPIPQSPMDYHPTPYAGSPNPLSKSAITSLYTSFAATKSDLSTPQSFGASKDTRPDITQADCGPATLLDRSPQVQEIVLDLKHATLVNFDHWVFRDSEDVDAGLVESKEGTHCAGASSCETSLADNESTEAIEPRPSTDKLKKCSDSVSRDVIVDFACLSTYPISALSASSTCAFSDIPPSGDNSAGAECVPLPIANTASCHWTSDIPLSPEQQCKGRISLTPYPEGLSMTIDFGSPELANLKATLEAIKLLDDPPTGIDQLSDDSSMATEILSNTIVVRVEEPLAVDPSSMAAEANGDKIHFEALPPVSVFLQAIPTPDPDPTWIADHRPGKENEATTTPDVPRDKIPAEDKAKRKPLSTVAIGSTADKADIRDRDRYRGAAYSRVLPKPCLSASSSMTSVALASVPQLTASPVLQNSGTPPLLSGVFIPSTNSTASQGQSKPSENRVVRNMTGTPRGVSFDSKDINVRQDDGTVCSNGKARRRKSILQCSTPDSNVKHGVRVAKGNLHEKSKSLSKSTGCQVKASTSGGLVK
ncbi:hypothetical protein CCMSSC00406_0007483 [Pleurotus cornucopiae]|uniref:Uncharacterized protein n=1 Tax=Pleurotus cornucopiae TaxID=5321 RepID=A0ACB7J568_PLECO|nr:hypothetical protein CCMSSC00406_0007483 [Pleurotus cornucopiae]